MPPSAPTFSIDPSSRVARLNGAALSLGARAFDVLAYLNTHSARVVTKGELLESVWGGLAVEESNLTVQISALRKALGPKSIATVPGVGYKLALNETPDPVAEGPDLPDTPSLAVLPFANLTGQASQEYLVDGIATELIGALTRIGGLFVIAASSSFAYKGEAVQLADVGRALGVRYVLEGSVQQAGSALRISVQLVEAATGRAIWTDRFSGTLDDIFDLQDRLTESVAAAIEPTLRSAEALRSREKPQNDLRAYDICLQVEPLMRFTAKPDDFQRAFAMLDEAVALDPDYLYARALRCWAYTIACGGRFFSVDDAKHILPDAYAILDRGTDDATSLTYAAHSLAYLDKGAEIGLVGMRKAKALNPNSVTVLCSSGWLHAYVGDFDIALRDIERALRLNPLDPNTGFVRSALGPILLGLGRVSEAVEMLEQSYHEAPTYGSTVFTLMHSYWRADRLDDAKRMAHELLKIIPGLTLKHPLASTPFKYPPHLQLFKDCHRAVGIPEE
ncbi:winged helix-turn-helix domain-containing protein [Marivita sp. S6314]|uniref:winged helix-turn-helix domain-containing protein n=1 Tax=Marivita sp. S6314 TaxID=2926406 RepID=UPI001FF1DB47|nr:winged helix-turn-helix domain-containing protein [Marivita sp. S6314]MCK0148914.1 winged helix-turn-helix domain-containing protein [Marivita sp. S6314]